MKFGEKVREARKNKGLSQVELAKIVGVTGRNVSLWETGSTLPRTRELMGKIADALDLDINYLLTEDESFMMNVTNEFGYRGKKGAEKLMNEVSGLFSGGTMAEEDMDAFMLAVQEAYVDAKRKNKKYTPKKYLKSDDE
ncbi:MAG: helix-turn-helix transcriptional regulator [Eubacteriales bacterium]|nr:helix-turn-helix transcriptional regulator [Eubacteriales bacterium]